jgi:hypothetical protein
MSDRCKPIIHQYFIVPCVCIVVVYELIRIIISEYSETATFYQPNSFTQLS